MKGDPECKMQTKFQRFRIGARTLLWFLPLIFLGIFFYQPLVAIFRLIFSPQFASGWEAFSWSSLLRPLSFTFGQASLSTLLTLVLGLPSAYIFSHYRFRGKSALRLLSALPFILPTVVVATGFNALLGPRGWVNLLLMTLFGLEKAPIQFVNTFGAILIAHVFYNTTIMIRIVSNAWANHDQRLDQAAKMLGAKPWQVFKEVTLPLLSPSILAASLLVFLFNFTSFGVVLMLGGPGFETLEVAIYTQAFHRFNLPIAGLLSIIQLICTLGITIFYNRVSRKQLASNAQNIQKITPRKTQTLGEKVWVVVVVIVLIALIVSPLAALIARSFARLEPARGERSGFDYGLTIAYYQELFTNRQGSIFYVPPIEALKNSLTYAGITILITLFLGISLAYALTHSSWASRLLDPLIMLPLGASAVTLGLGFIIVFNSASWNNPNLPLLLPIAHALVALPFVIRSLMPTIRKIPNSLRQAASILGASPIQVFREVDLPLLTRSILVSMIFAFTISLGEFGASSFITTPDNPTIPVAIYRYISQPGALNYGQALAMSTLLLLVCSTGIILIEKLRLPGEEVF